MDYSLLVGIHDCTAPAGEVSDFEDYSDDSSDEECIDLPLSPRNNGKFNLCIVHTYVRTCARLYDHYSLLQAT